MNKIVANQAFDLGTQFYNEGKLEEAVPYYKKAVEFFQELDDEQKQADILLKIAQIQVELGRFGDAYKYYENSLKLFNKIDDYVGAGYSLAGLGMIHEAYNRYDEARNHYKKAIKIFLKAKDYRRIGIVFNLIGNTCKMQEKLEYAIMNYNKAIDIFHKLNEGQEEADILLKIAEIQVELGRFDDAYKYYENSLKLFNRIDDYVGAGYSLAGLGMILEAYKKYDEARNYYKKAILKFKKSKDYKRAGMISNLIANTFEVQNAFEDALINYRNSLELLEKGKDQSREAEVYRAMERIQKRRSGYKVSTENLKTTVPIIIAFILISGFTASEIANGNMENFIFDLLPYGYTSHIWMPPTEKFGSLGGFYTIYGQGRVFNFHIVLPGAENSESPLDYTKEGLNGTGKINNIHLTYSTITNLLSMNLINAMFSTTFNGTYNMSCAAWTGNGTLSGYGGSILGTFQINGQMTYWEGNFTMKPEGNRIAVYSDYIYHPNNVPEQAKRVNKVTYM